LEIRERLRVLGVECEGPRAGSCEPGSIAIVLTTEPSEEALRLVTVSPKPAGLTLGLGWSDDDHPTIEIDGDFQVGRTHVITLPAGLTDEHGQRLGRRWRRRIAIRTAGPVHEEPGPAALSLSTHRGTYLRPDQARVGLLSEHVAEARVRLVKLQGADRRRLVASSDLGSEPWPAGSTTTVLRTLETRGPDARAEHVLELSQVAGQGDAVLVELEAVALTEHGRGREELEPVRGVFQISDIGAMVEVGPARGVVRAMRASTGEPWPGLEVALHTAADTQALEPTDARGLGTVPGAERAGPRATITLRDPVGGDRLTLPLQALAWPAARGVVAGSHYLAWRGSKEVERPPAETRPKGLRRGEQAIVAVQLGRGLYLPGDRVHLAGWAAISTPYGAIASRRVRAGTPVVVELQHQGQVLVSRRVTVDRHGRFTSSLTLPPQAPLGVYVAQARMLGSSTVAPMMLADARIPTFEATAKVREDGWVRGDTVRVAVRAKYLSGEPTPIEHLEWHLFCGTGSFRPAGYEWPWTFDASLEGRVLHHHGSIEGGDAPTATVRIPLGTDELHPQLTQWCGVSAAAQDQSLQQVGADAQFMVHPAPVYVGLRPPAEVRAGEASEVLAVAVDLEHQRVAQAGVEVIVEREPAELEGRAGAPPVEVARCTLDLPAEGEPGRCSLPVLAQGDYHAWATTTVDGRPLRTDAEFSVWPPPSPEEAAAVQAEAEPADAAAAAAPPPPPERRFEIRAPPRAVAGKPVDLRIEGPWDSAHGTLTVEQTGLRAAEPFVLEGGEAVVRVTPRAGRGPHLELHASVITPEEDHALPRLHDTRAGLVVEEDRRLQVSVEAPAQATPGSRATLRIAVTDGEERPIDARVAVWVVDDGLHQLHAPYEPALVGMFNPRRDDLWQRTHGYLDLRRPFVPWSFGARGARIPRVRQAASQVKGAGPPTQVRQRFEAVPLFEGNVGTGPDGVVELPLQLPDDLTRFRVTAVASAELPARVGKASGPARFGRGEATLEVSAPLMVRTVLPRVLRPGDRAELAALGVA
ncbi:MAG: hypothetical protein KDK70_30040, partial [Myxococcales bacterium]|nr:hypothetical protein [Myxococcales bacterium]